MLEKKLQELHMHKMGINELEMFRVKVINSLLDARKKDEVLKLIEAQKNKIDVPSALVERSEGISFD